jgi:peptidoglycan hydrolase CwlO-like protein
VRRRLVLFLVLAAALVTGVGAPAGAQQDPFDANIEKARQALETTQAEAHAAADKVEATREQQAQVEVRVAAVQAQIAEIEAQIPQLRAQVAELKRNVRARAVTLYTSTERSPDDLGIPLAPGLTAERRKVLGNAAAQKDDDAKAALKVAVEQLKASKQTLAAQREQLAAQQAQLTQVQAQLVAQQAELDRKVAAANAALERARALGALRERGEPVMGPTILSAAQMAAWWHSKSYTAHIATTVEDLANIYVQEGRAEGVRGDLAFAQAIVETGGFRSAPNNNYAGMGWCDSCSTGRTFPTPRDGIRAQIQHLKNYADSTSRSSGLRFPPSPYWYGSNPATAAHNFDTFFAKGWAPTWSDMGHGNWATDKSYSGKVLRVYADMVAFAQGG